MRASIDWLDQLQQLTQSCRLACRNSRSDVAMCERWCFEPSFRHSQIRGHLAELEELQDAFARRIMEKGACYKILGLAKLPRTMRSPAIPNARLASLAVFVSAQPCLLPAMASSAGHDGPRDASCRSLGCADWACMPIAEGGQLPCLCFVVRS